jgi:SWI/SNF-related matrix-associated actin-dependent regulator 1 of chromatin subfamily A
MRVMRPRPAHTPRNDCSRRVLWLAACCVSGFSGLGGSASPAQVQTDDYASMRTMWISGRVGGSLLSKPASSRPGGGGPAKASAPAAPSAPDAPAAPSAPGRGRRAGADAKTRSSVRKDFARLPARHGGGSRGLGGQTRECTVTLAFVSPYRFAASSSFPPKEVSDAYKMNMGRYEPDTKRWTFPFEQYERLAARLDQLARAQLPGFSLSLRGIPDAVRAIVREGVGRAAAGAGLQGNGTAKMVVGGAANTSSDADALFRRLPRHVRESLLEFQREGVLFALSRNGRVLIGDEMGLGKTIQAIAIASAYMTEWPLLVVCPSSMRSVWAHEIVRWLPQLVSPADVNLIHSCKDAIYTCPVTIVSYDLFAKLSLDISKHGFKVVIADESHYLKNAQAKRTMAIVPIVRQARRAILLTGTPALARPIELFNLLNCLHPALFPSYLEYAKRYCAAHQGPFGLDTAGSSNLEELHLVLQKHAMIRRLKRQVLSQLPPKRRQRIMLQLSSSDAAKFNAQIEQLKELERQADDETADESERMAASGRKRNLIMKLYVDTGVAKMRPACEYVSDLLAGGAKLLVFAHHLPMLDAVEECVKARKVGYIRIDGTTPSARRQLLVNEFQNSSEIRAAVLSITAAGTGLTLTAAHTVVFAELHWTPGVLLQAEDRVHRIGQTSTSVNIHYLIAQGSCDDLIWDSIAHKMQVVGRALDGQVPLACVCVATRYHVLHSVGAGRKLRSVRWTGAWIAMLVALPCAVICLYAVL